MDDIRRHPTANTDEWTDLRFCNRIFKVDAMDLKFTTAEQYMTATETEDYDVVLDTLQEKRDRLWQMVQQNLKSEFMGIGMMDEIRLEQIDQLDAAIKVWEEHRKVYRAIKKYENET